MPLWTAQMFDSRIRPKTLPCVLWLWVVWMPQYGLYVHDTQSGWLSRFDAITIARTVGWPTMSRYFDSATCPSRKVWSPCAASMRPSSQV